MVYFPLSLDVENREQRLREKTAELTRDEEALRLREDQIRGREDHVRDREDRLKKREADCERSELDLIRLSRELREEKELFRRQQARAVEREKRTGGTIPKKEVAPAALAGMEIEGSRPRTRQATGGQVGTIRKRSEEAAAVAETHAKRPCRAGAGRPSQAFVFWMDENKELIEQEANRSGLTGPDAYRKVSALDTYLEYREFD
jgi:hypothetical protein